MNRQNKNTNRRGAYVPKYVSVFSNIQNAAEARGIPKGEYENAIDVTIQALDNHPQHDIMTTDQEDCFVEYNLTRYLFGISWQFPGSLRPLDELERQSQEQEQPPIPTPREQNTRSKKRKVSSATTKKTAIEGKNLEASPFKEIEEPTQQFSVTAVKTEDDAIIYRAKERLERMRQEEVDFRKTFGDEAWERRVRRLNESAYAQRDSDKKALKNHELLTIINPTEKGKYRYSHVLEPIQEIRDSIIGAKSSLTRIEKSLGVKIKINYWPMDEIIIDLEPLDMEAAHKDKSAAVKLLAKADEFFHFHTWCGTNDVRQGRIRISLEDACVLFMQTPMHERVRMWMDTSIEGRVGDMATASAQSSRSLAEDMKFST